MRMDKLYEVVRSGIREEDLLHKAREYRQYPLQLSFSSYNRGMEWVVGQYRGFGLESEAIRFPADGKSVYSDRHFPLAWDVEEGWLEVTNPDCGQKSLASYEEDPYGIVPFCGDSNGIQEGRIIPEFALRKEGLPRGVDPVVVLFEGYPDCADVEWAIDLGCKACIAHQGIDSSSQVKYNARRWFNEIFGMGQIDARHRTIPAFSIAPRQAEELLRFYEETGPIAARYLVRSRAYEGEVLAATALIKGTTEPEQEVFLTAHGYEPHASNDVHGIAVCLGAAEVLQRLVTAGKLTPPARTIRFLHGLETFTVHAYAVQNRDAMRNSPGGLSIDGLGLKDMGGLQEQWRLFRTYEFNPTFMNGLAEEAATMAASRLGIQCRIVNGFTSNDNIAQDPFFGPGWVLLQGSMMFDSGVYHTNADTCDLLSPQRMAECAAMAATVAYTVASAGLEEAVAISQMAEKAARRRMMEFSSMALEDCNRDREGIEARIGKLVAFRDVAIPAEIDSIRSTWRLTSGADRAALEQRIAPIARRFGHFAQGQIDLALKTLAAASGSNLKRITRARPGELERRAAGMIPSRKLPGNIGLGTLAEEERREAGRLDRKGECKEFWSFFVPTFLWIDGKRSVLDIALADWALGRWNATEKPDVRTARISSTLEMMEFLERIGYVEIERREVAEPVTGEDIFAGLKQLGIGEGDVVMVHSSLRQFGEVVGGADTVVDALQRAVGSVGVLAMPAFTQNQVGGESPGGYDPDSSPAYTGAIPNCFRQRPGVERSRHPTHSIAAWGERAGEFLQSPDSYRTFHAGGPWGKLLEWKGKILFLGDVIGANTYLHALEAWLLNYLEYSLARVADGGKEEEVPIVDYPGGCREWYGQKKDAAYFRKLEPLGLYREFRVGEAVASVLDVQEFTQALHQALREDPELLLHKSGCSRCAQGRSRLTQWSVPARLPVS